MLTKTITYKDYDANERTEKLYFNMNQLELTEFAMDLPEDVFKMEGNTADENQLASHIVDTLGNKGVMNFIKRLVLDSYGVKSEDGRRFIKNETLKEEFSQTGAFDALMIELMSDDKSAAAFVNGIISPDLASKVAKKRAELGDKSLS